MAHIGLLFNMCYHVNLLSESTGGICINGFSYYVFCHADDLLFTSLTETGFQKLMGGGGVVTHIWDMGYWGVKNLGYGIRGLKNLGYGIWENHLGYGI